MALSLVEAKRALQSVVEPAPAPNLRSPKSANPLVRQSAVLVLFEPGSSGVDSTRLVGGSEVEAGPNLILVQRADDLTHHPGQIAFPGGGRESGDVNPVDTALREAREETQIDPSQLQILGVRPDITLPHSGNLVTPVLAWGTKRSVLVPDWQETVAAYSVPVAHLLNPDSRYTAVLKVGRRRYQGPMFLLGPRFDNRVVWGFTAQVISDLFDDLGWSEPWDTTRKFDL